MERKQIVACMDGKSQNFQKAGVRAENSNSRCKSAVPGLMIMTLIPKQMKCKGTNPENQSFVKVKWAMAKRIERTGMVMLIE